MLITKKGNLKLMYEDGKLMEAWSYDTCMMCRLKDVVIINRTKYSPTTSKQMTCHVMPALQGEKYLEIDNQEMNVVPSTLRTEIYNKYFKG